VWIADVDGTRFFIDTEQDTPGADIEQEIQEIVGSIVFARPFASDSAPSFAGSHVRTAVASGEATILSQGHRRAFVRGDREGHAVIERARGVECGSLLSA
jgi:hypothetical protein